MAKRGQKSSKREAEAGKKNLEAWLRENPSGGNLKHGIYSKTIRSRYSDLRTREGKELQAILDQIKEEVGPDLNARQHLIIAQIRSKLIIILQIGKYIESLPEVVSRRKGKIPHVLSVDFPRYSQSLTKLLDTLYASNNGKKGKVKSYRETVEELVAEVNKQ